MFPYNSVILISYLIPLFSMTLYFFVELCNLGVIFISHYIVPAFQIL